jgi:sec-independent protein translocase protein TatB
MFGIGWSECVVIIIVAAIFIGPKELPRVLYGAGKFFRKIKVFTADIQASVDKIMHEEELNEIIRAANTAGGEELQRNIDAQLEREKTKPGAGV